MLCAAVALVAAATGTCHARAAAPRGEPPRRYALVIANNASGDDGVPPLAYADDDGAKYFELFRAAGAEVALLAVLDPAAQRRYPEAAQAALPPTHAEIRRALDGFFARMRADRAAGRETHLYFVYAGHGNVGPNREGYLTLIDGPFRRPELFRDVIAASPATFNHLILDACHAYFVVRKRGGASGAATEGDKEGDFRAAVREFLRTEELEHYPNTGVIFASSSESETQEWSRWESGIFSHELRSALLGGADVDGDGRIGYAEAAAFVEAANAAVDIPRARLRVFYRAPPLRVDVPLLEAAELARAPTLLIDAAHAGRYALEDSRGVRFADVHSSPERGARLALVGTAPFFVRAGEREAQIPDVEEAAVGDLAFAAPAGESRGGVEATFRKHLFEIAFGPGFFRGVTSAAAAVHPGDLGDVLAVRLDRPPPPERARALRPWAWGALAAAAATAVGGGVTYHYAGQAHDAYERAMTPEAARALRDTTEGRVLGARLLFGAAGALAAAGVSLFVIDARRDGRDPAAGPRVAPALTGGADAKGASGGLSISGSF
jgi:hypothetical protein